jgi:hypothetical protein
MGAILLGLVDMQFLAKVNPKKPQQFRGTIEISAQTLYRIKSLPHAAKSQLITTYSNILKKCFILLILGL